MAHSPSQPKTASGKGAVSERKQEANEEMARFEDLAKKLLHVSKEDLKRELEKERAKKHLDTRTAKSAPRALRPEDT